MSNNSKRILMPIPSSDFDPTEVAIPWKIMRQRGIEIVFAAPKAQKATCDEHMLTGKGLGPFGKFLRARADARKAYTELAEAPEFIHPMAWNQIDPKHFDGIVLTGGHAKGMREILESALIQKIASEFMAANKPVGAICHGVVILARSKAPHSNCVLEGRKVTALLESQELSAWRLTKIFAGDYYRTYPETVESEVTRSVGLTGTFVKTRPPLFRDSLSSLSGLAVVDGNLVTARWPGDAYTFALKFLTI